MTQDAATYFENAYGHDGFAAQRAYPNEELLRFLGRTYFSLPLDARKKIKILEVGCGSGANLWSIAREGFSAYGVELSESGVALCVEMLEKWGVTADVMQSDMRHLPFDDNFFDTIIDVLAAYCLDEKGFQQFLDETVRKLKPGGLFFTYTLGKNSDDFIQSSSERIDNSTVKGLTRKSSPFFGNNYPIRFLGADEVGKLYARHGLTVEYCETIARTYKNRSENCEFIVVVGRK